MQCPACQAPNPDSHRFCEGCGASLAQKCASCGFDCSPGARFCGGCGKPLHLGQGGGLPAAYAAPAPSRPPAAMSPSVGWGELKQATVLFADVVSSTEQIARLDPEEAMERLKPAVMQMCEAVERFGGTVMRTLGDGVMALFGVPKALEGHARLGCQAALYMQGMFQNHPLGLKIRIGLHSGLVASDPHAPDVGKGGGAHGMTIHLASRVIALATPGGICITEACRSLLGTGWDTVDMGEHPLKGVDRPTQIFALKARHAYHPEAVADRAWATHFRGRDNEFEVLRNAFEATEEGRPRVVGVSGEAGAGKSRLSHEFSKWCRQRGVPVCEVAVQLYGHATPLQPVLEVMRRFYFGIAEGDAPEASRAEVKGMLEELGCSPEDVGVALEVLGLHDSSIDVSRLTPRDKHVRLLETFRRLVRSNPSSSAVLLIEDLHWLDDASAPFISALVESVVGTRTFVLLNYRSSYVPPFVRVAHFTSVQLSELESQDLQALAGELLGHGAELAEVRALVARRAAGNPFFAEELCRSLIDSGLIPKTGGAPVDLAAIDRYLPVTVHAVIAARIDALGEPEKTLLQMCAIIGKEIPLSVLENVASPLAAVIEQGLDGLCAAGLILQHPLAGRRHFIFRHPLIQEVAYGAQLKIRRQALHAAVAQAMEAYYASQLDEYAGLIAYHYEAAKQPAQAAAYLARSARWVAAGDPSRGIKLWYRVRELLAEQPRSPEVDSLRALAGGRIVYLGWREGLRLSEVEAIVSDAMALASTADNRLTQLLLFAHGRMLQSSGGPADGYVASIRRALDLPRSGEDEGRNATLHLALSHAYVWAGQLNEALEANDVAMHSLQRIDNFDREFIGFSVEQWALGIRVRILNRLGRFAESQVLLRQLLALSKDSTDPLMRQIAHHAYVDLAWFKRDAEMAQEHSQQVLAIANSTKTHYARIFATVSLGTAELIAGESEKAIESFNAGLELVRNHRLAVDFEAELLCGIAEAHLQAGREAEAGRVAEQAFTVAHARSNRVAVCRAALTLATARKDAGRLEFARALLAETGAEALEQQYKLAVEAMAA